jgi:hypothetical protein
MTILMILGVLALLVAVGLFFAARSQRAKLEALSGAQTYTTELAHDVHRRVVENLGTEALQQVCDITGIIECDAPLTGPLSAKPCVAYTYRKVRDVEEEVPPEPDDEAGEKGSKGAQDDAKPDAPRTQRRTETVESRDETVEHFWLRDDSGRILVSPKGAELDLEETGTHEEDADEPAQEGRRVLGYRTTEHALTVGSQVYILGCVVDLQDQPLIGRHPTDSEQAFLISWRTERDLTQRAESGSRSYQIAAIVSGVLGVVLLVLAFVL